MVVLNYNNYQNTFSCVKNAIEFLDIQKIVIVDNNSSNDSYIKLIEEFDDEKKVDVIRTNENRGYAAGNNFGMIYALDNYEAKTFIIANPDISITKDAFSKFIEHYHSLLKSNVRVGIVAPVMKTGNISNYGWRLPKIRDDILSNLVFASKINNLNYSEADKTDKKMIEADVVSGAFFVISAIAMKEVNFFDDKTFLYCEERILSYKLRKHSYKNYILTSDYFVHNHAAEKNDKKIKNFIELNKSKRIYHHLYLKSSNVENILFNISEKIGLLERKLIFSIKK